MPELPEVQTVVSDLKPIITGDKFKGIDAHYLKACRPSVNAYDKIKGQKVLDIRRRGKYINIFFENDLVLTIHLRMTGRLLVWDKKELLRFERIRIYFNKCMVCFCDMRKFGGFDLYHINEYLEKNNMHILGPEPLLEEFSASKFYSICKNRKKSIKGVLLDQHLIAGIGNIYADEACFYAGIIPNRPAMSLKKKECEKLYEAIKRALLQGIKNRGTSISDYQDLYGFKGKNQEILYVYSRAGKKCFECEEVLSKEKVAGRTTVFCLKCQK